MQLILLAVLCIVAIAVVFAVQNAGIVTVTFLFWKFDSSLALLLLAVFALGVLTAILASLPSRIRKNRVIAEQRKTIKDMDNNVVEDKELLTPSKFVN